MKYVAPQAHPGSGRVCLFGAPCERRARVVLCAHAFACASVSANGAVVNFYGAAKLLKINLEIKSIKNQKPRRAVCHKLHMHVHTRVGKRAPRENYYKSSIWQKLKSAHLASIRVSRTITVA